MFFSYSEARAVDALPGITRRTLAHGDAVMLCEFTLEPGAELPLHEHPHAQAGYIVSGRMRLTVGDGSRELAAGDSYYAPGGVRHGAVALERTVVADAFTPPREDYK